MKLFLKFDFNTISKKVLEAKFDELNLKYKVLGFGEVELIKKLTEAEYTALNASLNDYGIEIVKSEKSILVQKIKDAIIDMVFNENTNVNVKSSVYLSEKLEHSYGYLSNLFSLKTISILRVLRLLHFSVLFLKEGKLRNKKLTSYIIVYANRLHPYNSGRR